MAPGEVLDLFREPEPEVHLPGPRICSGHDVAEQDPGGGDGEQHPPGGADKDQPGRADPPPRDRRGGAESGEGGKEIIGGHQVGQPAHADEDVQRDAQERLEGLGLPRRGPDGALLGSNSSALRERLTGLVHQGAHPGRRIDIGHRDGGVADAQRGHELRGGQRAAAVGEEIGVEAGDGASQHGAPLLHDPLRVVGQVQRGAVGLGSSGSAERPGQGVAVHLAAGLGRQRVHERQQRDQRRRQALAQQFARGREVDVPARHGGKVADQDLVAGRGGLHCGRGAGDIRQRLQGGVDFTQLDPAAAELDLLIGAALENEALGFVPDQVAGAVGARPAQGRHGGVFLRVLDRVKVPGQPHAADDQFAHRAFGDGQRIGVDDGEVPAVQRQADPDGAGRAQPRGTRDHGGLGGPVGVPHFPAFDGEPLGKVRRTRLPAEDEQADAFQRLDGPERGERGDGGDHRDAVADEPGAEVHPGPYQRPGCRNEAGAVTPREPHFLAGGIEGNGQSGQHPVLRPHRIALQEDACLGVHERGGRTVLDRNALGGAGGAGGEDDPRVVVEAGRPGRGERPGMVAVRDDLPAGAKDAGHPGLPEDQFGPLIRVIGVNRDIGRTDQQHRQDRDVKVVGAGRDPDADLVAGTQPGKVQFPRCGPDFIHELGVTERAVAVVERGSVRETRGGIAEDVYERPLRRGGECARELGLVNRGTGLPEDSAPYRRRGLHLGSVVARSLAHCPCRR